MKARGRDGKGVALVLGSDTRSFLSVVRSLGRYGVEVHAAWTSPGAIALRSRYLEHIHSLPTPWESPEGWLESFNELLDSKSFDLVVPCNDSALIPLQERRRQINAAGSIYLLEDEAFAVTQSKILSTQLAESLGICVPEHATLQTLEQGIEFANEAGYPVVLKPTTSFQSGNLRRKRNVVTVRNDKQLSLELKRLLQDGQVQVQKSFEGVGTGVEFIAKEGKILFSFQHLRLHEPLKGGGSSYRKSIPLHPGMLKATKKLVGALHYSGVGMVEFRWNQQTDDWIFVEINGRFWGSLPLALASCADFPKLLYQNWVEQVEDFPQQYRAGVCCRNLERDKNWYSEQLSNRSKLGFAGLLMTESGAALGRKFMLREKADTLAWDDTRPFFAEQASIARELGEGIVRKLRSRWRHSTISRNRQRKRLGKQLVNAQSILFVCKGNICRSPFAAEYAKKELPDGLLIGSCGYFPKEGRHSPEAAQLAAHKFDVSLTNHRSVRLSESLVSSYDLIFVFDEENFGRVTNDHKDFRSRVFFLRNLASSGVIEVADPYGKSVQQFEETYEQISKLIDGCAAIIDESRADSQHGSIQ